MDVFQNHVSFEENIENGKKYYKNPLNENKVCFQAHANLCSEMIIKAKEKYSKRSEKLVNHTRS